ncbi:MAG: reverse transcriptase-like protein [Candidatus Thiodiazotropha taylori]|nr:reverse transcriptase-like protein [Candidatus Thiodiazotropha taylori]MCW4336272.1 reverse transcriptase domain-containing protein [Candidatus Thiodiazotropha endolucinida]
MDPGLSAKIRVLQWNARSLFGRENKVKLGALGHYLETLGYTPEVLAIQETFSKENSQPTKIPGYKPPVTFSRKNGERGGGVATYIKIGLDSEEIKFKHTKKDVEVVIVRLFGEKENIDIVNFYARPQCEVTSDDYDEIYQKLGKKSIFLGDFNARHELWETDLNPKAEKRRGLDLVEFINTTDYVVLNTGCGTRLNVERGSTSAIDLTLVSAPLCGSSEWRVGDDTMGSDHFPILTSLNVNHKCVTQRPARRWKLDKADWDLFRQKLKNIKISLEGTNIDENNEIFVSEIMAACEKTIPKTQPNNKQKNTLPWWDENCSEAVKKKNKIYYKYRKNKTAALMEEYRRVREETKYILYQTKQKAWRDFVSTLTYKTDSRKIWNTIKRFNGKPLKPVEVLKQNNTRFHNNEEKAEVLAQHYRKVCSNENLDPNFRQIREIQDPMIEQAVRDADRAGQRHAYNANFCFRELQNALNKKKSTAPGADTVHYDMLKNMPEKGKYQLLALINKSWSEGTLPSQWKESTIVPILKPDKDPHEPKSYRPISLTSSICKIMETMVASRLTTHIEKNNFLANEQSGFRKHRSTIDQITRLESAIRKAKLRKHSLVAVFLDLEKAFDLLWTNGVLLKLTNFGIQGKMLTWIQDFLTGRKMNVRVGNTVSGFYECENGSPQGSVLSPILFNLLMNTLQETLDALPLELSMFADDGLIWKTAKKPNSALPTLQVALQAIHDWATNWGFKLSTEKTTAVVFNRNFADTKGMPRLRYDGQEIKYASHAKFLGMCFDSLLTWRLHIEQLVSRCQRDLNVLRAVSGASFGADKKTLIMLYTALIRSKIDYGCQAYASAAPSHLRKLDSIQATALRIVTGAYRGTRNLDLEVECSIMPLHLRRDELQLKYWARSSSLGANLPINKVIDNTPSHINRDRLRGKIPYILKVQDLIKKHYLEQVKTAEKTYLDVYKLRSLTANTTLTGLIKKSETSQKDCYEITESHISENYRHALKVFTDGSKDNDKQATGCAFTVPELNFSQKFKLDKHLTVYTAELIAILKALEWIQNQKPESVVILTDSLSSIQSINSGSSNTRQDILQNILLQIHKILKLGINLNIDWIPSHCNVQGNELADSLAKEALTRGKELDYLPTPHEVYSLIKASIKQEWARIWRDHHGLRHSICQSLPPKLVQYSDSRKLDRIYTRLRLGVNGLNAHNTFYGEADPLCGHCGGIECIKHYLTECPAHGEARGEMKAQLTALGFQGELSVVSLLDLKTQEMRDSLFCFIEKTNYLDKI